MPKATTQERLEERARLTPQGEKALDRFMAAKLRVCPLCRADALSPCTTQPGSLVRAYFHSVRYRA